MASKKDIEYTDEQAMQKTQKGPPKYRTSQPIGLNDRGEPFYGVSYKPEFKETSVQKSSDSYNAGAGRGRVNPDVEGKKKGGMVSASKRADGCCTKGKTRGKMI